MIGIGILTTVQIGKYSKKICSVKRTKAHFSKQSAPALGRALLRSGLLVLLVSLDLLSRL